MLEKHEVRNYRATTKYKHSICRRSEQDPRRTIIQLVQDAQELNDPDKGSSRWVRYLFELVDKLNGTTTQMIGMKPKDAIKFK